MSNTTLERTRVGFEQIEALDRLIVEELERPIKNFRDQSVQGWRLTEYLQGSMHRSKDVLRMLRDADGFRKEEVLEMSGVNALKAFYDRIQEIKQHYRRFPNRHLRKDALLTPDEKLKKQFSAAKVVEDKFSGEEFFGKCVDLHQLYVRFTNLKGVFKGKENDEKEQDEYNDDGTEEEARRSITYRSYLDIFHDRKAQQSFDVSPVENRAYLQYLRDLVAYLLSFRKRTEPLLADAADRDVKEWEGTFEEREGKDMFANFKSRPGFLDLSPFETASALEALGGDRLKIALQALGIKCGGSVSQRAQRLMIVKQKGPDHPDVVAPAVSGGGRGKKRRRRKKRRRNDEDTAKPSSGDATNSRREIRKLEYVASRFAVSLRETVERTKRQVEQKQIRTWEELKMELEDADKTDAMMRAAGSSDEDEDEEVIYNPKKVPLGWDGKPIAYWLYRLHGLNKEYTCEICGNETYRGRRDFDRHFQEARHAAGMRALGIPNTKHFHDVTKIKDAQDLYKNMMQKTSKANWDRDNEEEFEDSDGNVLTKKMHDDLARQGLL
eukprot:g1184.t1